MLTSVPRRLMSYYLYRPWWYGMNMNALSAIDSGSKVTVDKDKFQVSLDVKQFSPNEITVKTVDNYVTVEGKHEEKQDDHGYISRQFIRRYALPEGHDPKDVVSSLSSDGVLTVTAPRQGGALPETERVVPISATGPSTGSIEDGKKKESGSSEKIKEAAKN